jgi:small subunit ribosomal protein S1
MSGSDLFDEELQREVDEALSGMSVDELEALADPNIGAKGRPSGSALRHARIDHVAGDVVFVDLGGKSPGMLPITEFDKGESVTPGSVIEVFIDRFDERDGLFIVSKHKAEMENLWASLKPGAVVEGRVTGMNKGGLEVDIKGIRAFMPASQVDLFHVHDISIFLQQTIRAEVTQVDRSDENVVISRRKFLEREKAAARDRILAELAEGQVRQGVVRTITPYGAFVDLGGVDGLLHVSDMSWSRVKDASEVVQPGQTIEVKVLKIDREKDRISLGLKQILANPWTGVADRYQPGQHLKGRVTRLAEFGAFVEVEPGLEGLVPIGEMSWVKRVRHPSEIVQEGSLVDVVVLQVDPEKHRMSLGMRQVHANPWDGSALRYPPETMVSGKVARLSDFGAFVEVEPGIEGLVHISQLSDHHVKRVADVVQPGQEVMVRVLSIDPENQRLSLSLKGAKAEEPKAVEAVESHVGREKNAKQRKRKRPLRGGLDTGANGWLS